MAKEEEAKKPTYDPKAKRKVRADKYEEKVNFEGTFEDMITISTTGARAKKKIKNKKQ